MEQLAGAGDGGTCKSLGQLRRQPDAPARLGQALRQIEDIGRARAGHRGHGVEQVFLRDPGDVTDGAQQPIAVRTLARRHVRIGDRDRNAAAHRRGRVRHGADHRAAIGQVARNAGDGAPGGNRQHDRVRPRQRRQRRQHLVHDLRLHRQDDHRRRLG